ncbi:MULTISPECIES: glycosyltransferase family 39 protein [Massilia]|jgi:4-amino-4-deoxy-L-arabinose transferase-like glycosyltransferase|uniref:ArnT family glycosyltransferase n=1 Tax=Massilia TaxID=149698 RepID=UPI0009FF1D32|nr:MULTISPECIES: glycosyltransferase family 39 protein [Massilia]MDN4038905.1 glycosyltransferase family 39 protein [Massilia sp. YIM B02443]
MDGAQQDELAMQNDGIASAYPKRAGTNFLLALGAYFVLQIILRTSSPAVLDLDESEQVLAFQHLQLGYGSQPPLYAWLQWLMFSVFGVNRFALSFLKNLLLFGTYLAMFHAARSLVGITGGIIVAASLVLFPQIGWESQRDLTHSVLMTCMAALTLWCYFALLHHPGKMRHALFGLLIGLGLQSKYNFALFALALTMASLLVREHRERLWSRRAWISLAVIAIAVAPHGLWLLNHLDAATRSTLEKMNGSDAGYIGNVVRGLGSMVSATFLFVTPLWMVYAWVFWRRRAQAEAKVDDPHARFFLRFYLAAYGGITALVLSGELTSFKDRWMQPILFLLPLACFVIFPSLARRTVCREILQIAGMFAMIVLVGLSARAYLGKNTRAPYVELSATLLHCFPEAKTLIANELTDAGNLYLQNPTRPTMLLSNTLQQRPDIGGKVLLIDSDSGQSDWMHKFLRAYPSSAVLERGRLAVGNPQERQGAMSVEYALVAIRKE